MSETEMDVESKHEIVLCRVCDVVVPKRKDYRPTICEACKKFFTRNCRRQGELVCSSGTYNCAVQSRNRRFCTNCRFSKCLSVGMKCRLKDAAASKKQTKGFTGQYEDIDVDVEGDSNEERRAVSVNSSVENIEPENILTQEKGDQTTLTPTAVSQQEFTSAERPGNDQQTADVDVAAAAAIAVAAEAPSSYELVPLVRDPIAFDGTVAENLLRKTVHAFTLLHGLDFLALKRPSGDIYNVESFWVMAEKHIRGAVEIGFSYGRFVTDCENVSENTANVLMFNFLTRMSCVFMTLPCNPGATCFGISDMLMPAFLMIYPEFKEPDCATKSLASAFSTWSPSLIECSIFFAYTFFNSQLGNGSPETDRIRRRLLLAFNLYLSSAMRGSADVQTAQRHFANCLQRVEYAITVLQRSLIGMTRRTPQLTVGNPLFQQVFLTPPTKSRLSLLFPK